MRIYEDTQDDFVPYMISSSIFRFFSAYRYFIIGNVFAKLPESGMNNSLSFLFISGDLGILDLRSFIYGTLKKNKRNRDGVAMKTFSLPLCIIEAVIT